MNERIQKLAQQAGFQSYITTHAEDVAMFEKFAELLESELASAFSAGFIEGQSSGIIDTVHECCTVIEREYKYAHGEKTQWAMSQDVQDLLKGHFGVDE